MIGHVWHPARDQNGIPSRTRYRCAKCGVEREWDFSSEPARYFRAGGVELLGRVPCDSQREKTDG